MNYLPTCHSRPCFCRDKREPQKIWTYPDSRRHNYIKKEVECQNCKKEKHRCESLESLDYLVEEVKMKLLEFLSSLNELKVKTEKQTSP